MSLLHTVTQAEGNSVLGHMRFSQQRARARSSEGGTHITAADVPLGRAWPHGHTSLPVPSVGRTAASLHRWPVL